MATQQTHSLARFMMAPSVILLFIWMIVPLAFTLWFSFLQYNPLNPMRDGFVGFSNYALFYSNPAFLQSILNTLTIVVSVLVITVIGVILIQTIFLLSVYAEILVTTNGGPGYASTNLPFLVYQKALLEFKIGQASAGGVIAVILANIVAFFVMRAVGKNLDK